MVATTNINESLNVSEVGHDRTIINNKPEHIDTWLNPGRATASSTQLTLALERPLDSLLLGA